MNTNDEFAMTRLSIPGNECSHCGTVMTAALRCEGCGWVDPLTRPVSVLGADTPATKEGVQGSPSEDA